MNPESPTNQPQPIPLQVDYMDDNINDTLSDIHAETNNELEINQIVAQTFSSFFHKPNDSLDKQPIETSLQPTIENLSGIKLHPVRVENNLRIEQKPNAITQNQHNSAQHYNTNPINSANPNPNQNPTPPLTNIPQKKDSQLNIAILFATIFLYAGIIAGIILISYPSTLPAGVSLLVVPYLVYLVLSLRCNTLSSFMRKLKKFQQYKQTYDHMVSTKPQFRFYIFCYHYDVKTTNNVTRRQMVTTHTATENYSPQIWADQSGDIAGIKDIKKYVFIQYERSYYFADKESEERFNSFYKNFVQRNKKDKHQDYSHTFELPGFINQVGFSMLGHSPHSHWLFYLFTFLGLALPYNCILERSISRYSIKIVKRIGNPS